MSCIYTCNVYKQGGSLRSPPAAPNTPDGYVFHNCLHTWYWSVAGLWKDRSCKHEEVIKERVWRALIMETAQCKMLQPSIVAHAHAHAHLLYVHPVWAHGLIASYPGREGEGKKRPGTYRMRMCEVPQQNLGLRIRLYIFRISYQYMSVNYSVSFRWTMQ